MAKYIPKKGDLVWLNFSPQKGHEQSGHRPALVVSSATYNKIGLLLACPITSKIKGYPFEVRVKTRKIDGCILADHIKNLDWKARKASFIEASPEGVLTRVQEIIAALMLS